VVGLHQYKFSLDRGGDSQQLMPRNRTSFLDKIKTNDMRTIKTGAPRTRGNLHVSYNSKAPQKKPPEVSVGRESK